MILLFLLLIIVPLIGYKWAKKYNKRKLWTITCASLGAVVSPLAYGIYGIGMYLAFLQPYIGLVFIAIAGAIFFFHSAVGYKAAIILGIQTPAVVTSGMDDIWIDLINGIVWGAIYGLIGYLIDRVRNRQPQIETFISKTNAIENTSKKQ